jgi:hypothetical protein
MQAIVGVSPAKSLHEMHPSAVAGRSEGPDTPDAIRQSDAIF